MLDHRHHRAGRHRRWCIYYFKFVRGKKQKDEDLDFFDDEGYEEEPYINEDEEPVIADDEDDGDETKETEETI